MLTLTPDLPPNLTTADLRLRGAEPLGKKPKLNDPRGSSEKTGGQNADSVSLSPEAKQAAEDSQAKSPPSVQDSAGPKGKDGQPLDESEQKQVEELQARDREVRQHEQAHKAAAGAYATSGPTYSYQEGPDGKRYAVGGSVGIDVSAEATPEETIAKMQVVRRAALAPAEPSSQDRKVAAQAAQIEQQARAELAAERQTTAHNTAPGETESDLIPDASAGPTYDRDSRIQSAPITSIDTLA